jgi:DNA-binding GntR family transcriptional regulator
MAYGKAVIDESGAGRSGLPARVVARERVRQSVVDYIKELIFNGELQAGDRLPQDELAKALRISNTPVREAIIALEHEGILFIEPNRGAFVNPISASHVRDQYELLALLWGWAVSRTVEHVQHGSPESGRAIAELARKLRKTQDPHETFDLMILLTSQIERTGGSAAWRRLVADVPRILPSSDFYQLVVGARKPIADWIGDVAAGVQGGDAARAVHGIEQLMLGQGEALIAELTRRDLFSDDPD